MTARFHIFFSAVLTLIVIVAIVWGVTIVGLPARARTQRFDQQRLDDLRTIFGEIQLLCHDPDIKQELKRPLPESLDELALSARSRRVNLLDPETGERYGYSVKDATSYELCARFSDELDSDVNVFWNHPAGKHCFTVDALDPPKSQR